MVLTQNCSFWRPHPTFSFSLKLVCFGSYERDYKKRKDIGIEAEVSHALYSLSVQNALKKFHHQLCSFMEIISYFYETAVKIISMKAIYFVFFQTGELYAKMSKLFICLDSTIHCQTLKTS